MRRGGVQGHPRKIPTYSGEVLEELGRNFGKMCPEQANPHLKTSSA